MNKLEIKKCEKKIERYLIQKETIDASLRQFLEELKNREFSFSYQEAMNLEKFSDLSYRLTFWRTDYSKERVIIFCMCSCEIDNKNRFFLQSGTEDMIAGHLVEQTCMNLSIKDFMDKVIQETEFTSRECEREILQNKMQIYRLRSA